VVFTISQALVNCKMAKKLLCLASLVAAPWLVIGGLLMVSCGLLLDGQPELVAPGALAALASAVAGLTASALLAAPRGAVPGIGERLDVDG
jgi:uncharacterized membrane protein